VGSRKIEYEVVNGRGRLLFTAEEPDIALRWAERNRPIHADAVVEQVIRSEVRFQLGSAVVAAPKRPRLVRSA
jgi:hypothetical protein